jgi:phosphoglycolate phosphatase-like HAD superfamily hydrolase
MRAYIFDIDGTLSDPAHRLHHIEGEAKNWDAFFAACDQDSPIPHMIDLVRKISVETDILFVTGRSDEVLPETVQWLTTHLGFVIGANDVYMRKAGDHRPDIVIKSELMDQVIEHGYEPILVFEDRASVVKMWRERGIPCLQVQAGNY